jgi:hypothetical protein
VADLLEQDRVAERSRDVAQPADGTGEVRVTVALDRLLQRVGMHRQRVGTDPVEHPDEIRHGRLGQLRQPDVSDQQHIRRDVTNRETGRRLLAAGAVEHDPLRSEHHPDTQPLRGGGQVAVDSAG